MKLNGKILLILGTVIVIATATAIYYLFNNSYQATPVSSFTKKQVSLSVTPSPNPKIKEFVDPSGFKFNYPEDLVVKTKESTGNNIYSSLQILSENNKGEIIIRVESSNLKDLAAWLKTEKKLQEIKKIKLAELEAVQFKQDNLTRIVAHDTGATFTITIDAVDSEQFWSNTADIIVKSFAFVSPQNQNSAPVQNGEGAEDVILEGEEIVE